MTVYHGSVCEIPHPDVAHSKPSVDFGPAFDYYTQQLEKSIILHLAEMKGVELSVAMDLYYHSRLADQISRNEYDIAFLDSKYLARDLIENEPEVFGVR